MAGMAPCHRVDILELLQLPPTKVVETALVPLNNDADLAPTDLPHTLRHRLEERRYQRSQPRIAYQLLSIGANRLRKTELVIVQVTMQLTYRAHHVPLPNLLTVDGKTVF